MIHAFFSGNPSGSPPTLARLAWSRLAFGPRPEDLASLSSFNLMDFLDEQLSYEDIDDSACEAYVNGLSRVAPGGPPVPPLDASLSDLRAYITSAGANDAYLQRHLWTATYARALLSKRQLFEVMVDFWTNHLQTNFHHYTKYWEDYYVIRQHALGNFRELIGASAKSPSMLYFLSNAYSDGSNPNENYARELMELHTVGSYSYVPGPGYRTQPNYTEEDVHTAAQILSGWTTARIRGGNSEEFLFNATRSWPRHHWQEKKLWLGNDNYYRIPFGGIEQGERLLDILAEHPSTAYFISFKLCRRFISDWPDQFCPNAIAAGAQAFLNSHGDIRETVRAIILHPDFANSWGQKVKRPFEFMIAFMRGLGLSEMINFLPNDWSGLGARTFQRQIEVLGQVLFEFAAPTGLPDVGLAWWTTGQLFDRWTLANMIVNLFFGEQRHNNLPDSLLLNSLLGLPKTATEVVDRLIDLLIGRAVVPEHRTMWINYLGNGNPNATISNSAHARLRPLIGAIAASSYFQWR